ncbi:MAG: hypothetical protein ACPGVU_21675 [Limisphaerales bacterium]
MDRRWLIPIGCVIVVLLFLKWGTGPAVSPTPPAKPADGVQSPGPDRVSREPLPGDELLAAFATTNTTTRTDLRQILRVFDNALVLVKQADTRHYATNEDLADFLRGKNRNRTPFVSHGSKIFGTDGRLIDRWGNPLHVHSVSSGKIELRSAGPDGVAWNEDDVLVDSSQ